MTIEEIKEKWDNLPLYIKKLFQEEEIYRRKMGTHFDGSYVYNEARDCFTKEPFNYPEEEL